MRKKLPQERNFDQGSGRRYAVMGYNFNIIVSHNVDACTNADPPDKAPHAEIFKANRSRALLTKWQSVIGNTKMKLKDRYKLDSTQI